MSNHDLRSITFEEAIERTRPQKNEKRHLLLGNGFSISARGQFKYKSLYDSAQPFFSDSVRDMFKRLQTEDFEEVLKELQRLGRQSTNEQYYNALENEVREAFLRVLQTVHPAYSMSLTEGEIDHCATFLEYFVGSKLSVQQRGRVYTTNYDLLLYWVIVRSKRGNRNRLHCYDGHEPDSGIWQPKKNPELAYLHGGLHLYGKGDGQIMLRYHRTSRLIDQTRERLDVHDFPVIIAEGTSEDKAARIQQSKYLKRMRKYWADGFKDPDAALFTYGHSLSDRDAHLLKAVGEGETKAVYIGARGGLNGHQRDAIDYWTNIWAAARTSRSKDPPEVLVYDSSNFSPWR